MIDKAHRSEDKDADGLISLLTPVIKGFLTDKGYDMTVQAQQGTHKLVSGQSLREVVELGAITDQSVELLG